MFLSRKISKIINRLQKLYMSGIVTYPRVDNNFINKSKAYDMYAHPRLVFNSSQNREIKGEVVSINKESSLLFLSLLRIVSPANLESFAETIDAFFNNDLAFKDRQGLKIIEKMESFLKKQNYSQKKIIQAYSSLFVESRTKRKISFYKIENSTIGQRENSRIYKFLPSFTKTDKKDKNSDKKLLDGTDYYDKIKIRKNIKDALSEYDRYKKKELEIAEQLLVKLENLETTCQVQKGKNGKK